MMTNMESTKFVVDEDPMVKAERHEMLQGQAVDFAPDKPSPEQPRIRNRREKRANQARNRRKDKPGKRRH